MKIDKPRSTARITVRNYRKADLPFLTAMWFDEENGKYLSDPTRESVDRVYQTALEQLEDSPNGYYLTVVLNDPETIVGSCFLFPDDRHSSFEIAYCIHKDCWGRGLGKELLSLIVDWVRDQGGAAITAEAAKKNLASHQLLIKSGFQVVGEAGFQKYNTEICFESYLYRLCL